MLSYARDMYRGFAWGVLSLTLGLGGAVGIPVVAGMASEFGLAREPFLSAGELAGLLAVVSGYVAVVKRRERICAIFGIVLGVLAFFLLPMLQRA